MSSRIAGSSLAHVFFVSACGRHGQHADSAPWMAEVYARLW